MSRVKCNTCGGEYEEILPDGLRYFHQCPSVPGVKVRRADGSIVLVPRARMKSDDVELESVTLARTDARNENVHPTARDANGKATILAEGRGVTAVAETPIPVVDNARAV